MTTPTRAGVSRVVSLRRLTFVIVLASIAAGCGSSNHVTKTADVTRHTVTDSTVTNPAPTSSTVLENTTTTLTTSTVSTTNAQYGRTLATLTRPFATDSPWNRSIADSIEASNSAYLLREAEYRYGEVVKGNSLQNITTKQTRIDKPLFINTRVWTDPIVIAGGDNAVRLVCRQINLPPPHNACGDGWQISSLNIPVSGFPKPSYDGWLTVYDESGGYAYDFWRARFTSNNTVLSYQFVRRWNLNGPGFLPPDYPGARGSGLPLFAGEILPSDIRTGVIMHALAISVPGPAAAYYVQPASATDGNGSFTSLPEGARLRLRADYNIDAAVKKLPGRTNLRAARAILIALKTYGAIVVDRSAVPTLYALPDYNWNQPLRNARGKLEYPNGTVAPRWLQNVSKDGTPLLSGNVVQTLTLDDFQVVDLPKELQYPPLPNVTEVAGINGVQPQSVTGAGTTSQGQVNGGSSGSSLTLLGGSLP